MTEPVQSDSDATELSDNHRQHDGDVLSKSRDLAGLGCDLAGLGRDLTGLGRDLASECRRSQCNC